VIILGEDVVQQALPAIFITAVSGIVAGFFVLLVAKARGHSLGLLGLGGRRHLRGILVGATTYITGLPLLIGWMGIWSFLLTVLRVDPAQDVAVLIEQAPREQLLAIGLLATLVVPWGEEVLFRGALLGWLHGRLGATTAVIGSSLAFALIHPLVVSGPIFVLALLLASARLRSHGILACLVMHGMHNGLQILLLIQTQSP